MYSFGIFVYSLLVRFAALFNKKARLLVEGQRNTWKILEEKVKFDDEMVWFHAASLGEFEQGRPLIERFKEEHPEKKVLLTFFSPSGYEVRKDYGCADVVCYLPFDTPLNARRFVRAAHPVKAFFIKYEFWRNYIDVMEHQGIPVYSVSSIFRPKQIFFRWYGKGYGHCLRRIAHFFVQNEESKELLNDFGIQKVTVTGDTRFSRVRDIKEAAKELPVLEEFAKEHEGKHIVVAGSTWAPDEDILIDYVNKHEDCCMVLAPHVVNEEHLQQIESKLKRSCKRYTQMEVGEKVDCVLIDCYRMLSSAYRYATVAYVGGGFGAGIHNVPEAAVYGVPVVIGPNNRKFKEAQDLKRNGGCKEINSAADFVALMDEFEAHPEELKLAGKAAHDYIKKYADAADVVYAATLAGNK